MASAYAPRLKKQRYDVITCRKNGALTFAHGFPAPEQYLLQDVAAQLPKLNISFGNLTSESSSDQARKATAKPLLNASYDCHVRICVRLHDGGTRAPPVFRSAAVRVRGSSTEARSLVLELEKPVEISIASLCEFGREEVLLTRAVDVNFDIFANGEFYAHSDESLNPPWCIHWASCGISKNT